MVDFTPKKIEDISQLNKGKEYVNGVDIPDADDWNKVIESQLWVQKLGENPVDNTEADNVGTAELVIAYKADGIPYLKAKNLKGKTGNGITVTMVMYAVSASNTTVPSSGWTGTIPSVPAGQYLWTRIRQTYTDGTTNISYSVARQGLDGTNGSTPTVLSSVTGYQNTTSGTVVPEGGWNSAPSPVQGTYLWSMTVTTWSTGGTTKNYAVSYTGKDGEIPSTENFVTKNAEQIITGKKIFENPTGIAIRNGNNSSVAQIIAYPDLPSNLNFYLPTTGGTFATTTYVDNAITSAITTALNANYGG